jgi:hypothetical protein
MCQAFRCASAQQAHERVATLAKAFGTLLARKQMKDASDAQSSVYQAPSPTLCNCRRTAPLTELQAGRSTGDRTATPATQVYHLWVRVRRRSRVKGRHAP